MTQWNRKSIIIICTVALTLVFSTCTIAQESTTVKAETAEVAAGSEQTNVTEEKKPEKPKLTGNPQIDYKLDPNLPRELKGFDLSNYPFYGRVPNVEFNFSCEDRHDGFYASMPHKCQVYHQCLFSVRYDFLCPNYTAFDQANFICHFANEVDCVNSELYFFRNDALYEWATTTTSTTPAPQIKIVYVDRPVEVRQGSQGGRRKKPTPKPTSDDYYYYEDEKPITGTKNEDKKVDDDYYYDDAAAEKSRTSTTAATTTRRTSRPRPNRPVRTRTGGSSSPTANEKTGSRQPKPVTNNEASQLPNDDFVEDVTAVRQNSKTKANLQATNNRKEPQRRRRRKKTTTTSTTPAPEYYDDEFYDYYEDETPAPTTTTTKSPLRRRQGQGGRKSQGGRQSTQEERKTSPEERQVAQEKKVTAQEELLAAQEELLAAQGLRLSDQEERLTAQEERLTAQERRKVLLQSRKSLVTTAPKATDSPSAKQSKNRSRKPAPIPEEGTGTLVEDAPLVLEDAPLAPGIDYEYEDLKAAEELVEKPVALPSQSTGGRRPGHFKRPVSRPVRKVPREL